MLWFFRSTHLCELSTWRRHQGLYDTVSLHGHEECTAKQLQHSCCWPEQEQEQEQFLYFLNLELLNIVMFSAALLASRPLLSAPY